MRRSPLLAVCLLALLAPRFGARAAAAQVVNPGVASGLGAPTAQPTAQVPPDTVRVTLDQARSYALARNPELAAARLDTSIARGWFKQAGVYPFNPSAEVIRPLGEDDFEVGIAQEVEIFWQRGPRRSVARYGLASAAFTVTDANRVTVGGVDRRFYRLASAMQRVQLAREVLILNERLADVARRQMDEGEISRLDFNLALVELGRARARILATERERADAAIELGRFIGLPRTQPIVALLDSAELETVYDIIHTQTGGAQAETDSLRSLEVEERTAVAQARRPDLQARAADLDRAEAEVSLARRSLLPNPVFRGLVGIPRAGGAAMFRPGIGITLPFLNRRQGERQALRAAVRQADLDRASTLSRVQAEVAAALSSYHSALAEVQALAATVLAPARQNRQLAEVAYREGEIGLPVLLVIQNQAIDAELDYWSTWLVAREAQATLIEATGENLDGTGADPNPSGETNDR